jgi:histidinol-phosphate aminotransferase
MTAEPRAGLREMAPYVSAHRDVVARLNTNESPHPLPEGFVHEMTHAVQELPLNRYPDGSMSRLRQDLATYAGHPVAGTWVANGSNEIIAQLLQAYGGPGRRALTFEPTYLLHSRLAWLTHTELDPHDLAEPFSIGSGAISAAVAANPRIVFICSPNNPTGNAQPVEAAASLATELPRSLVIVDEAYIEFGGESALKLVDDLPNVVIVRTFSKAFALAGARIGYVLAAPEVIRNLEVVRLPYNVSSLTQAVGIVALRHVHEAIGILEAIRAERERVISALAAMDGVKVFGSDANFVLFVPPRPAAQVWNELVERGVLIRDMSSVVPNALRVTAGTPHEVDLFLECLSEVLAA